MKDELKEKLDKELSRIRLEQKRLKNLLLEDTDIDYIFNIIKENDKELEPLFSVLIPLLHESIKNDYLLVENTIKEVLKYYKILNNENFIKSRHKLFFTENRSITKKPFFSPIVLEKIKNDFEEKGLFKKIL